MGSNEQSRSHEGTESMTQALVTRLENSCETSTEEDGWCIESTHHDFDRDLNQTNVEAESREM